MLTLMVLVIVVAAVTVLVLVLVLVLALQLLKAGINVLLLHSSVPMRRWCVACFWRKPQQTVCTCLPMLPELGFRWVALVTGTVKVTGPPHKRVVSVSSVARPPRPSVIGRLLYCWWQRRAPMSPQATSAVISTC